MRRLLLLAGTTEARLLAHALAARPDLDITASLAGRTADPVGLGVEVRTGGFGGTAGLTEHLRSRGVEILIDATHPFAAVMPWHAQRAASALAVPRLRILRPRWTERPGDRWTHVATISDAPEALLRVGATRVLVTTGRTDLGPYAAMTGVALFVRSIEPLPVGVVPHAVAILDRGPFAIDAERTLLTTNRIDAIVTKDSGGDDAKLVAARELGIPVVVVDRPSSPPGPMVADVPAALAWLADLLMR